MARTYAQIQTQIRKLQHEANALKAKEVPGVVARIREAIKHYGLTAQDLFGNAAKAVKPAASSKRIAEPSKPGKASKPSKAAKPPAPARFQDEAGHQWSGIGKRPNWFKAALAAGKTSEQLRIQQPTTS